MTIYICAQPLIRMVCLSLICYGIITLKLNHLKYAEVINVYDKHVEITYLVHFMT